MGGHYADVLRLVKKKQNSDTFAKHFASTITNEPNPTPKILRTRIKFSILWPGNPVSVQKSYGTKDCVLCMKERTSILKCMYEYLNLLINNNFEIYGSCRHKPRFHRFFLPSTGTNEFYDGRKSRSHDSPTSENSEETTIELDLNNTYTNCRVVTNLESTPAANSTGTDPKNYSNTEYDLNLSVLSDFSCFPWRFNYYETNIY